MGRPPTHGAPSFRFFPAEVAQMETLLREHGGHVPSREVLLALADKFSNTPERSGKITVQMKQVWNWFQNRRYALRSKLVKPPGNMNVPPNTQGEVTSVRNVPPASQQTLGHPGLNVVKNTSESTLMEFEAKSARDGAWYDVQAFHAHRYFETGNPEVLVRFSGFGPEEDEWVNVLKYVRQRSLPCESSECVAVLPGDLILCFQEGKEQALYFDAHVLDAQRRRHDLRGCRCRFLVRYDHDQSEEIVPLRKVCRRPETDYRLQVLHAANESASTSVSADSKRPMVDSTSNSELRVTNPNLSAFPTVTATTSINAGTGVSHPAQSANPILTVAPAPAPTLAPALASPSGSALAPAPAPAPALAPALATTLGSAPAPAPAPTLAPALATTSGSALAPAPTPTPTPTPTLAPALATTSGSALAPASASALASTTVPAPDMVLAPALASTSVPAPALSMASALTSTSISALVSALASTSIPAPAQAPALSSTPISTPAPVPNFASASDAPSPALASTSDPAPAPALASAPVSDPALTPALDSDPALCSAPSASTIPISAPTPSPTLNVTPMSVPDPVSAPAAQALPPTPAPVLLSVPAAAPELQKIEDDNPGTSASEASDQEIIINPGAAIVKVKEEESSNPEGFMLSGSSISQGETSDNTSILVPEPEKVEDRAPSEPMSVSTATTDGGLTELTKAESGNLAVSAEDTKA